MQVVVGEDSRRRMYFMDASNNLYYDSGNKDVGWFQARRALGRTGRPCRAEPGLWHTVCEIMASAKDLLPSASMPRAPAVGGLCSAWHTLPAVRR